MSKAHQNSDLLLANRPVVIDSPMTAHWTFNNGLVSQGYNIYPLVQYNTGYVNGDSPNFPTNNAEIATSVEGFTQRYNSIGLIVPGKFGNALARDESTVNIVPNPHLFSSGWTSYINGNDGSFITEFGTEGLNIINRQSWCGAYKSITLPSTGTYTISVWAKAISRTYTSINIKLYTNGFGLSDTLVNANWSADKIGKWQKLTMTLNCTTISGNLYLICYGGTNGAGYNITAQYTMPQIEAKTYNTRFTSGTRNETLLLYKTYPTKTFSLWVKSNSSKVVDGINIPRTIAKQIDTLGTYPYWTLYVENTNTTDTLPGTATAILAGSAVLKVNWSGVSMLCTVPISGSSYNILDGNWHHIVLEFGVTSYVNTNTVCRIWVDDSYGESLDISTNSTIFKGQLRIGFDSDTSSAGNFSMDDMRIDNKIYSKDDIKRRYLANVEYLNPFAYGAITIL